MKIFVTGCAGLLGANYTRHLLNNGHEVIGIDDLSGGYKAFIAEGEKALAETFDDYELMRPLGLNSVINVPMLKGSMCYATFNVFGTRGVWQSEEIAAVRLLALATERWVQPFNDLDYRFDEIVKIK